MGNLPIRPNTQPNQEFQDLLLEGKKGLAEGLIRGPTEGKKFADLMNRFGASRQGGNELRAERQQQTENKSERNRQLQGLLEHEDNLSIKQVEQQRLQLKQINEKLKADGDELGNLRESLVPDEVGGGRLTQDYMRDIHRYMQENGLTSEEQIPIETRRQHMVYLVEKDQQEGGPNRYGAEAETTPLVTSALFAAEGDEADARGIVRKKLEPTPLVSITNVKETEEAKKLAEIDSETYKDILEAGNRSANTKGIVSQARAALESGAFTPGAISSTRLFLAQLGQLLGVEIPGIENAATGEAMEAAFNFLAVEGAKELSRATNMQVGLVKSAYPQLGRTFEGNTLILDMVEAAANRNLGRMEFAMGFVRKYKGFRPDEAQSLLALDGALFDWDKNNPIVSDKHQKRMNLLLRTPASTLSQLLGDVVFKLPEFAAEVHRMSSEEFDNLIDNLIRDQYDNLPIKVQEEITKRAKKTYGTE